MSLCLTRTLGEISNHMGNKPLDLFTVGSESGVHDHAYRLGDERSDILQRVGNVAIKTNIRHEALTCTNRIT